MNRVVTDEDAGEHIGRTRCEDSGIRKLGSPLIDVRGNVTSGVTYLRGSWHEALGCERIPHVTLPNRKRLTNDITKMPPYRLVGKLHRMDIVGLKVLAYAASDMPPSRLIQDVLPENCIVLVPSRS